MGPSPSGACFTHAAIRALPKWQRLVKCNEPHRAERVRGPSDGAQAARAARLVPAPGPRAPLPIRPHSGGNHQGSGPGPEVTGDQEPLRRGAGVTAPPGRPGARNKIAPRPSGRPGGESPPAPQGGGTLSPTCRPAAPPASRSMRRPTGGAGTHCSTIATTGTRGAGPAPPRCSGRCPVCPAPPTPHCY